MEPPDTPETKSTLPSSVVPPGAGCAASCLSTPNANAAARVPPPEKASPMATPLSPRLGKAAAGGGTPCSGTLIGALAIVVQHDNKPRRETASTCCDMNRIVPPPV